MADTPSYTKIGENRWQLCHNGDVLSEGTLEAVQAAARLLFGPSLFDLFEEGRHLRAGIESRYARLQTLTPDDFKIRSR